jgi:hypothetical protein
LIQSRRCPYCQSSFLPSAYRPQQSVCGRPECQRRRRSDYHRKKLATDPEYFEVVRDSQKLMVGRTSRLPETAPPEEPSSAGKQPPKVSGSVTRSNGDYDMLCEQTERYGIESGVAFTAPRPRPSRMFCVSAVGFDLSRSHGFQASHDVFKPLGRLRPALLGILA